MCVSHATLPLFHYRREITYKLNAIKTIVAPTPPCHPLSLICMAIERFVQCKTLDSYTGAQLMPSKAPQSEDEGLLPTGKECELPLGQGPVLSTRTLLCILAIVAGGLPFLSYFVGYRHGRADRPLLPTHGQCLRLVMSLLCSLY
jgi:hypothetical protein